MNAPTQPNDGGPAFPVPNSSYPNFEQAFAESKLDAKDKDAAFKLWKGGAK